LRVSAAGEKVLPVLSIPCAFAVAERSALVNDDATDTRYDIQRQIPGDISNAIDRDERRWTGSRE
jgi:hypothetical protein